MKVKVEKIEGSKAKLDIVLTKEEFNEKYEKAFTKVLEDVEVKGFRKGKVPREMYLRRFGEGSILKEAIDIALNDTYYEAVESKKLQVVSQPEIDVDFEHMGKDKPFKYTATVEVYPEVTLGKYFGVEVRRESDEVTVEEIDQYIERQLKNNSELEVVEGKPLEKGETAIFDFTGYVDGKEFEGGKAENYSLEIGSGQFIPGFEDQMVGMNAEEEKDVNVTFPDEYQVKELAGKPAVFKVKLHEIKKRVLPELNDEFVKGLEIENVNTVEEYRKNVSETLGIDKKEANENKFTDDVLHAVCDDAKVEIPEAMVQNRLSQMISQIERQAKAYGITADQLLAFQGTNMEQYKEMMTPAAKRFVLESVVIEAVKKEAKVKLVKADYDKYYNGLAKEYNQTLEQITKNLPKEQVKDYFTTLKTIDLLKENAVLK